MLLDLTLTAYWISLGTMFGASLGLCLLLGAASETLKRLDCPEDIATPAGHIVAVSAMFVLRRLEPWCLGGLLLATIELWFLEDLGRSGVMARAIIRSILAAGVLGLAGMRWRRSKGWRRGALPGPMSPESAEWKLVTRDWTLVAYGLLGQIGLFFFGPKPPLT